MEENVWSVSRVYAYPYTNIQFEGESHKINPFFFFSKVNQGDPLFSLNKSAKFQSFSSNTFWDILYTMLCFIVLKRGLTPTIQAGQIRKKIKAIWYFYKEPKYDISRLWQSYKTYQKVWRRNNKMK